MERAARYAGYSREGLRKVINRGELPVLPDTKPVKLSPADVEAFLRVKQEDALRDLVRRRQTPETLARDVRHKLLHQDTTVLPDHVGEHQRLRLSLVPDAARHLFGTAALNAVFLEDGHGCRWCRATEYAEFLGTWAPTAYGVAFRELFGQLPCEKCGPRLYGVVMESLRAQVHAGGERAADGRVAPSAAERERAEEWARQRAVTAAAKPVQQDDGGRALVAKRLRETRARAKAAKRSGDRAYALRLAQMARDLEKDAARVDGGAVTASARPGRLRCGHTLASGCSCPRRASTR